MSRFLGISAGVRRRIQPNPPAGDVRLREYQHGPWIQLTNRRVEAENAKAEGVIFEKRVFDLAKQAVAGLHGEAGLVQPDPSNNLTNEVTIVSDRNVNANYTCND